VSPPLTVAARRRLPATAWLAVYLAGFVVLALAVARRRDVASRVQA
jgi:hypothetical protein